MRRTFAIITAIAAVVVALVLPVTSFASGKGGGCAEGYYPPITGADTYVLDEGSSLSSEAPGVLANDQSARSDSPGLVVTAWWIGYPDYGHSAWIEYGSSGSFTFTPPTDFSGVVDYYYVVADQDSLDCDAGVLVRFIVASGGNDSPVAQDDTLVIEEDSIDLVDVVANDTDPDGDTIAVDSVVSGQNGTCTVESGQVRYVPNPDFNGYDSCSVTINDGVGGMDTSTLFVAVSAINDPPTAQNDTLIVDEDTPATANVVVNDTDVDGDTIAVESVAGGQNGACTVVANRVRYTPSSNLNGTDSCTVTISDGTSTDTSTLDVTVSPVNDTPVANFTVTGGTVSANADGSSSTDVDGDPLTYTWNFSDGTGNQSGGTTISHQYRLPGNYTVILTVADTQGASNTLRQAVDVLPNVLQVANASLSTPEGGKNANHAVNVVVTLAQPTLLPITFNYATTSGSATSGSDYYATSGSKTIPAGQSSVTIPVTIIGDNRKEADETFSLSVSAPNYEVVLGSATTTIKIVSDD